jgi:hypothetical protein
MAEPIFDLAVSVAPDLRGEGRLQAGAGVCRKSASSTESCRVTAPGDRTRCVSVIAELLFLLSSFFCACTRALLV